MANEGSSQEALAAVYIQAGKLLSILQTFKYSLSDLLADHRPVGPGDSFPTTRQIFDDDWGNLVAEFCFLFSAPDDVTSIVKTIPSLINYLTNHCFFDNAELMLTDAGCYQVRDELREYYEGMIVYQAFLKDIDHLATQGESINWESLKRAHDWRRFTETSEPPPSGIRLLQ